MIARAELVGAEVEDEPEAEPAAATVRLSVVERVFPLTSVTRKVNELVPTL